LKKPQIKMNFVDFWPNFQKKDNYFFHLLSQKYEVHIDEENPDVVIGSYGFSNEKEIQKYANHRCLKIYYTGESDGPRNDPYDLNITQWRGIESQNHMRFPLWAFFCSWFDELSIVNSRDPSYLCSIKSLIEKKIDVEKIYESKKRFCNFIYADLTQERRFWFEAFDKLSKVDASGLALNNTGFSIAGRGDQAFKMLFQSEYLFTLSIENKSIDGYLTEKMIHPMSACSIPIYWGDPRSQNDFNDKSYINISAFPDTESVVERVRELLNDKNKYMEVLSEKWFNNVDFDFSPEKVLSFIENGIRRKNS